MQSNTRRHNGITVAKQQIEGHNGINVAKQSVIERIACALLGDALLDILDVAMQRLYAHP